jgi:hypothetical protein
MTAKRRPAPVTIRRIGSDEPSVTVKAADLTHPVKQIAQSATCAEQELQPIQSADEPRLLVGRPPNAITMRETGDGHGDYTSLPYAAMHGEPEAVSETVQTAMSKEVTDREASEKAAIAADLAQQIAKAVGELEAIRQAMKDSHVLTRRRHHRLQAALGELRAVELDMRT